VDPGDGLPLDSLGTGVKPCRPWEGFQGPVYVQPCDDRDPERNRENVRAAVESCMRFGYLLCVQLHKVVGLP
jgi:7-carboxy-7-deazaguanine synthase